MAFIPFILFIVSSASAQSINLRAQVSTTTPSVGEPFTYQVTVSSQGQNVPRPQIPEIPDFDRVGSSTSQNFSFVNGTVSSSISFIFTMVPRKAGNFEIPPASINVDGQTIQSNTVELVVSEGASISPQQRQGRPAQSQAGQTQSGQVEQQPPSGSGAKIGIEIIPSKTRAYLGEPVTLSTVVYGNTALAGYSLEPASPQGFWIEEAKLPDQPEVEKQTRSGEQYYTVLVRRQILFPTTTGRVKIPHAKGVVQYLIRRQERSPFDDFFNDRFFNDPFFRHPMFNRSVVVQEQREAQSGSPEIAVLPLPERGRPANFNGAVGSFKMKAELEKSEAHVGEAVSIVVNVEGKGNLKGVTFSGFKDIPGLNLFTSTTDATFSADKYSYNATKRFEYVVVPLAEGKYLIPSVEFAYFNPADEAYKRLSTDTMILTVIPGAAPQGSGVASAQILSGEQKDIIENHEVRFGSVASRGGGNFFLLMNLIPVAFVLSALLYRRHLILMETDPKYGGIILSRGAARKYLKSAARALRKGSQEEFYCELTQALSKYIGHRFRVAPSAVQPESLDALIDGKAPKELIARVREAISKCHMARYAQTRINPIDEEEDLRECESIIKEFDRL